jgi:hypothetical protein
VGTKFTEELRGALFGLRSRIQINGQAFFVASIDSDTQLTLSQAPTFTVSGVSAKSDFNDSALREVYIRERDSEEAVTTDLSSLRFSIVH